MNLIMKNLKNSPERRAGRRVRFAGKPASKNTKNGGTERTETMIETTKVVPETTMISAEKFESLGAKNERFAGALSVTCGATRRRL